MSKQNKNYIVGIYLRLSKDDERLGESLSIANQKLICTRYVEEQGCEIHDIYIDDGISGTTFDRPEVHRLLDDAKAGVVNLIIVKDLSRFGRNYIEVGQYVDYIFPLYGIRFIALQDNVDTANSESAAMDMMPIMNVFNEWHAANTSKKIRAVKKANAKNGKYNSGKAPFGYVIGNDEKRLPVVDPPAAEVVRRIFELRARGVSRNQIARLLNNEKVLTPSVYSRDVYGKKTNQRIYGFWTGQSVANILKNPVYRGDLVQLRQTTVSYKNHKRIFREESDMVIVPNTHEAIVSRELWGRVREIEGSVSQGKWTQAGDPVPLSGLMYCADCGAKMKLSRRTSREKPCFSFDCGNRKRFGKLFCFSHHISLRRIEKIILTDIREKASRVATDEETLRNLYLERTTKLTEDSLKAARCELERKRARAIELENLIEHIYEDKVSGKIPENVCVKLLNKYLDEQKQISIEIRELEQKSVEVKREKGNLEEFMKRIKKYLDVPELTREMCLELIDRIIIGGHPKTTGKPRTIQIVYKVDINSVL